MLGLVAATSSLETGVIPDTIKLLAWMSGAFTLAGIISILSGVLSRRRRT